MSAVLTTVSFFQVLAIEKDSSLFAKLQSSSLDKEGGTLRLVNADVLSCDLVALATDMSSGRALTTEAEDGDSRPSTSGKPQLWLAIHGSRKPLSPDSVSQASTAAQSRLSPTYRTTSPPSS